MSILFILSNPLLLFPLITKKLITKTLFAPPNAANAANAANRANASNLSNAANATNAVLPPPRPPLLISPPSPTRSLRGVQENAAETRRNPAASNPFPANEGTNRAGLAPRSPQRARPSAVAARWRPFCRRAFFDITSCRRHDGAGRMAGRSRISGKVGLTKPSLLRRAEL